MRSTAKAMALFTLTAAFAAPAKADLIGSLVSGTLQFGGVPINYFDPAKGFVPAGFGNSAPHGPNNVVVSASTVEFGFSDGVNSDTVDLTGNTITLSDVAIPNFGGTAAYAITLTDSAFAGLTLAKVSDSFPGGVTASLSGSTVTINYAGTTGTGSWSSLWTIQTTAVPEPSPLILAGVAGLFVAGARFRRRRGA